MFLRSCRPRVLVVCLLSAVLLILAYCVAQIGTQRNVLQRMNQTFFHADRTLHEIK